MVLLISVLLASALPGRELLAGPRGEAFTDMERALASKKKHGLVDRRQTQSDAVGLASPTGVYSPALDSDSCGIGFIARIDGAATREVLEIGLRSLSNVTHRGAIGADGVTGDGAGVLTNLPAELIERWLQELGSKQDPQRVAVAALQVPADENLRQQDLQIFKAALADEGLEVVGVREVPVNPQIVGPAVRQSMPVFVQAFVAQPAHLNDQQFQQRLYLCRREIATRAVDFASEQFYVCSISKHRLVYKALVRSDLLSEFFADLRDPAYSCSICLYHQRFSTNTVPSWYLCQPFRMLAHNGEINTIRGNRNWMNARQKLITSQVWGEDVDKLFPLLRHRDSDSASLDNTLELLANSGRSVLHAMSMLIPPAWQHDPRMESNVRDFYEFHSCFSEPWDGPAAVAFTDGQIAAACLDRNGLRPARFKQTTDGLFILGSEAGCDGISDDRVTSRGRLGPGQMVAVDTVNGEVLYDEAIKRELAAGLPYGKWLQQNRIRFNSTNIARAEEIDPLITERQIAAGLTLEDRDIVLRSMVDSGRETTFSMGLDTPLAVLSDQPQVISRYSSSFSPGNESTDRFNPRKKCHDLCGQHWG